LAGLAYIYGFPFRTFLQFSFLSVANILVPVPHRPFCDFFCYPVGSFFFLGGHGSLFDTRRIQASCRPPSFFFSSVLFCRRYTWLFSPFLGFPRRRNPSPLTRLVNLHSFLFPPLFRFPRLRECHWPGGHLSPGGTHPTFPLPRPLVRLFFPRNVRLNGWFRHVTLRWHHHDVLAVLLGRSLCSFLSPGFLPHWPFATFLLFTWEKGSAMFSLGPHSGPPLLWPPPAPLWFRVLLTIIRCNVP